jgi:hypothetical protein
MLPHQPLLLLWMFLHRVFQPVFLQPVLVGLHLHPRATLNGKVLGIFPFHLGLFLLNNRTKSASTNFVINRIKCFSWPVYSVYCTKWVNSFLLVGVQNIITLCTYMLVQLNRYQIRKNTQLLCDQSNKTYILTPTPQPKKISDCSMRLWNGKHGWNKKGSNLKVLPASSSWRFIGHHDVPVMHQSVNGVSNLETECKTANSVVRQTR